MTKLCEKLILSAMILSSFCASLVFAQQENKDTSTIDPTHMVGDIKAGEKKAATCIACHGADGNSPSDQFPKIAGQVSGYIAQQLAQYKSGQRDNAVMYGIVAPLSAQDMANLDAYYNSQIMTNQIAVYDNEQQKSQLEADIQAGRVLYKNGQKEYNIAPCQACHGPAGQGIAPHYPRVAGQYANYLEAQLLAYKNGERKNQIMNTAAYPLSEQQIQQLALYMSVMIENKSAKD